MDNPELGSGIHPRQSAEFEHQRFVEKYESILERAEMWQLRLDQIQGTSTDAEEIFAVANEAVDDLDQNWEYTDCAFLVAGVWIVPRIGYELEDMNTGNLLAASGLRWEFVEEDVCEPRFSRGWGYQAIDGKLQLGLVFKADSEGITVAYVGVEIDRGGLALPRNVSLELLTPPTEQQVTVHAERVIETIELYDKLIQLYIGQESFYSQPHKKQKAVINQLLKDANNIILAPGVGLYLDSHTSESYSYTEASTAYGFSHETSQKQPNEPPTQLQGCLMGVGFLEQEVLADKAIRSVDDFIDPSAGLCLIVEVYGDNQRTLYVPWKATTVNKETLSVYNGI